MKTLALALLTLTLSHQAFARGKVVLTCATKPHQTINRFDGYLVVSGQDFINGKVKNYLKLQSFQGGQLIESDELTHPVQGLTKAQIVADKEVTSAILSAAKVKLSEVASGRLVVLGNGQPAPYLINYLGKEGNMLTGAILVPAGLDRKSVV